MQMSRQQPLITRLKFVLFVVKMVLSNWHRIIREVEGHFDLCMQLQCSVYLPLQGAATIGGEVLFHITIIIIEN